MDKNLTVQEALTKLLVEKKSLLNDGKALVTELRKYVAPMYTMQLALLSKALLDANIGEALMAADGLDWEDRVQVADRAVVRLQEVHMPEERALCVVQMLIDAMGWKFDCVNELKFFPVMGDKKFVKKTAR